MCIRDRELAAHREILEELKEDVGIIKTDIEFVKGDLKKKVDYDEFQALEKRFTLLESRVNKKLRVA